MARSTFPIVIVISLAVLMIGCFVSCLAIAFAYGHIDTVNHTVPYISDLGVHSPEKYVFRQLLNMAAFVGVVIMFMRYAMLQLDVAGGSTVVKVFTIIALIFGFISAFSMSFVANFEECDPKVEDVHTTSAICLFFAGIIYTLIDSILTAILSIRHRGRNWYQSRNAWFAWFRHILALLAVLDGIVGFVGRVGILEKSNRHCVSDNSTSMTIMEHMNPQANSSYTLQVSVEWIMGVLFIAYNLSFIPEFHMRSISLNIDEPPPVNRLGYDEVDVDDDDDEGRPILH